MELEKFLEKEEVTINGTKFIISCLPAVQAQEMYGKIYKATEEYGDVGLTFLPTNLMVGLLSYAAVCEGEEKTVLDSEETINDKVRGINTLIKLEAAIVRKNFGFLFDGSLQKVLEEIRGSEAAI